MAENVISVRVSDELRDRLDSLASATQRPRSFLAQEAIAEYLDRHAWQVAAIDEAVASADSGRVVGHDAVAEWLESWGSEAELDAPRVKAGER